MQSARITVLRDEPPRPGGRYVLYWMQQAMRAEGNFALDHAVELANELKLPVAVCFGLTGRDSEPYPEANARHYAFMLDGLREVQAALRAKRIPFVIRFGSPADVAVELSGEAAALVCDRGHLRVQRAWRASVAERARCRVVEVETDSVVPTEIASPKHEVGARTLRPKMHRVWDEYLVPASEPRLKHPEPDLGLASDVDLSDVPKLVASLKIDQSVGPVRRFRGGLAAARERLGAFLAGGFDGYKENRGEPDRATVSHMSPYLHFGQISPLEVALAARDARTGGAEDKASFLEELIVRRELARNHCWYEPAYDRYEGVPAWARASLAEHAKDKRPKLYSREQLEAGETDDRYWNAAQQEMRDTGYTHNRMRLYWGKKFIEWTRSPEEAFATALAINNKYFLCGRDANSYTNIAWLFGLHDRPWFRRPIFGMVRYIGANTLKKFDADAYVRSVWELSRAEAA